MKECCGEVLWKGVVEKCFEGVFWRSVGEECWRRELKEIVEKCCSEVL